MRCPSRASSTIATSRTNMRIACLIETVCRAVLSVLRTITADITAPPSLDQECTIPELLAHRAWNPPPSSWLAEERHLCSLLLRAGRAICRRSQFATTLYWDYGRSGQATAL